MAKKENDRKEEEKQETPVPETAVEKPDNGKPDETNDENDKAGSGGFGKVVLFLVVFVIASLFAVPQTREKILDEYRSFSAPVQPEKAEMDIAETVQENPIDTEPVKAEDISIQLEQIENEREFENAQEIVSTIEPPPAVSVTEEPDYISVIDRQKALLSEIGRLRFEIKQIQDDSERQIDLLKEIVPDTSRLEESISNVQNRGSALEQKLMREMMKIDQLEKDKADSSLVLSLMSRMDEAEQKLRISNAEKERAVSLLLAVYQLREAALSGQSFAMERQTASMMADPSSDVEGDLKSLSRFETQGIKTKSFLIRSFDSYADRAVLSEMLSQKQDWFHQAINSLKELVIIRKTRVDEGDMSAQGILARAGQAVRDEDLADAVSILKKLTGTPADVMREWIYETERYLTVKKTIDETISAVLGVIYSERLKGEQS